MGKDSNNVFLRGLNQSFYNSFGGFVEMLKGVIVECSMDLQEAERHLITLVTGERT